MVLPFCSTGLSDKWRDVEEVNNSSQGGSDRSGERYQHNGLSAAIAARRAIDSQSAIYIKNE